MSENKTDIYTERFNELQNIVYYCYGKLLKDEFITKSREDMLQEGFLALWKACCGYNDTFDVKLSTYAFASIQNAMLRWVKINREYYYNHVSFETPVEETETLTIGDTIPDKDDLDINTDKVKEILEIYKRWLVKTRVNSNQNYINMRIFRAYIILNEIVNKGKTSSRYIESEFNINRTTVWRIFQELRECLKETYPTRFKNGERKHGTNSEC